MPSSTSIPIIVQGNTFSLAIPLQIYVISEGSMVLQDYTPDPTDQVSIQLKGSRRQYTYAPTITGNTAFIGLSGNEMADNYGVVVSIVKENGQRLRSFRTDQFFIVESSDDLTTDDIIEGLENNVIYLNSQAFVAGEDGRGIDSIVKTSTSGLVDTYTIYYSDNTTSTYQVTNGAQGADGVGIASIAKTSTSGLVDTYTITLENDTTSTFQVTNGRDGVDLGLTEIVNDFETGGTDKVLSAEMGKVIMYGADEMVDVDYEFTQSGKYMSGTIGQTSTEGSNAALGYIKIPVNVGDAFFIEAKGYSTVAPTYVLTDENLLVYKNRTSDSTSTKIPVLIEIEQSGFLIVNNLFNQYASPKVTKVVPRNGEFSIENNGAYVSCSTVGNLASKQTLANYSCVVVPVFAGQRVTIYTKGEGNNRAWALLDEVNYVLSNSAANLDARSTPVVLDIENTCKLAINNRPTQFADARYIIEGGGGSEPTPNLTDHEERITALESGTATNELKILCVGNSFTGDTLEYMQSFLTDLDVEGVTIYKAQIGGSTLQVWWDRYINDTTLTPYKITGYDIPNIGSTLKELFAHDWDFIMFQAYTGDALAQYNPYICDLATHARKLCTNVNVKIALNLPWSSSANYSSQVPKGVDGFNAIASAYSQAVDYFDNTIDVVIPTGTALQNARGTTLTNEADLTKDYHHAAGGVAKYIITATFFEALIKPFTKISAFASTLDISATASSSDLGAESVTSSNRTLCLTCAEYAIVNPFNISTVVE